MIFEKGDIVKCTNGDRTIVILKTDSIYTVESVALKNTIKLIGVEGNWRTDRFTHTKQSIVKKIIKDL